jgi:hypothetical protein
LVMTDIGLKVACLFSRPGKHVVNVPQRILRIVYFMLIHPNDHWKKMMTECIHSALWEPSELCSICGDDHYRLKPTVYKRISGGICPWIACVSGRISDDELQYLDDLSRKLILDLLGLGDPPGNGTKGWEYIMELCSQNGLIVDEEVLPEDDGFYTNNYKELVAKLMKI